MSRTIVRIALACSAVAALVAVPSTASAKQKSKGKSTHHSHRKATDRNRDGIPDTWERHFKLSLKVNQARRDQDKDGLNNRAEFLARTNPRSNDSDGDGTPDGQEHAGRVASYDGTTLVVDLFGGTQLSAAVTADTEIQCEAGGTTAPAPAARTSKRGGSQGGNHAGQPGDDQGEDDQGDDDANEDQGDDDGAPVGTTVPPTTFSHGHHTGGGTPGETTPGNPGGHDEGDDQGDDGEHGGDTACPADAVTLLVPGAVIHEGSVDIAGGQAVWHEITVVVPATPAASAAR